MSSMLHLPNELLQEIAGYLPYSDYVNLLRVNKRLRQCCHHQRSVLLRVARDALRNTPGAAVCLIDAYLEMPNEDLPSVQLESPDIVIALNKASLSTLERMACVAERCAVGDVHRWTREGSNGLWDWLPHMLGLQCPTSLAWSPAPFLQIQQICGDRLPESRPSVMNRMLRVASMQDEFSHEEKFQREAEFISINFVLIYASLQCIELNIDDLEAAYLFDEAFLMNRLVSLDQPEQGKKRPAGLKALRQIRDQLEGLVPAYGIITRDFDLVQGTALLPVLIYELVIQFHDAHLAQLPKPRKIPFTSFMDIPEVLNGTAEAFSQCHVASVTSSEFLTGSWMGYYSDQRIRSHHFDPPMENINIIARPAPTGEIEGSQGAETEQGNSNKIKTVIDPISNGVDRVGNFTLHGTVGEDGMVNMTKHYAHAGWTWSWYGRVTPFGIVGAWGNNHYFGGYFWIWKKEWC